MASLRATAAIAITLIIAIPILLGYGMASTQETSTAWERNSVTNVSDSLVNYETDYTAEYMNPYNNKELLTSTGSSWTLVAPEYINVGTTYTSLPDYEETSTTVSLTSSTTHYAPSLSAVVVGSTGSNAAHVIDSPVVRFSDISPENPSYIALFFYGEDDEYFQVTDDEDAVAIIKNGDSGYIVQHAGTSYYWTTWRATIGTTVECDVVTREYVEIDPGTNDIAFVTSNLATIKVVTSSETYYSTVTDSTSVVLTAAGAATVGSTVYEGVTGFYIAEQLSVTSITYSYTAASGTYADPAGGWRLLDYTTVWWMNGQQNESVRFLLYFPSYAYTTFGPVTATETSELVTVTYSESGLVVTDVAAGTSTNIGDYTHAMVELTKTGATVYGLTSWPTLGVWPTVYNSVTVDYEDLDDAFRYVNIEDDGSTNIRYRVDVTQVVAGTFPSSMDRNFSVASLFPGTSFVFTVKSVALYGDAIGFNDYPGTTLSDVYTVTDGTITVDGETYDVRGLEIKVLTDGSTYDVYLDDTELYTDLSFVPYIWFGGEWSLTASVTTLTETTSTQQVWAPGVFAFDKEAYAACGLLVAGACLIGLGMHGSRSGTKMGLLLMICGGAGLIYLTIL